MSFNSDVLKELLSKSDKELWIMLRLIASQSGVALPEAEPSEAEMKKLRSALLGAANHSYEEAANLLKAYKRGKTPL